jgi:TusA-related sulfurtransferase
MAVDLVNFVADKVIDARSMACPGPLLEAKRGIGSVAVGQSLEIQSGDHGSQEDIPAWCKKMGHEYLGFVERDGYDSLYVRRKK